MKIGHFQNRHLSHNRHPRAGGDPASRLPGRLRNHARIPAFAGMTILLFTINFALFTASPAHAQYKFNRSGHTGAIDQSGGDTTVTQDSAETMVIDGTGRVSVPGGVDIAENVTCSSAADAGTIRFNSAGAGIPTSGLAAYWKLNESGNTSTAADSAGTYTGTLTNFPANPSANWVSGKISGALDFDGTNDRVAISDASALEPTGDMSISLWVKLDVLPSAKAASEMLIYKAHTLSPWFSYQLFANITSDNYVFDWYNTTPANFTVNSTTNSIKAGVWQHMVLVKNGSNGKIYVNNIDVTNSSGTFSGSMFNSNSTLNIGAVSDDTKATDGLIDDVRIYNRALSPAEIEALYNYTGTNAAL